MGKEIKNLSSHLVVEIFYFFHKEIKNLKTSLIGDDQN
jgi:hypothetical protein